MGILEFFIEIKADNKTLNFLMNEYRNNQLYQAAFYFNLFTDDSGTEFNAGISSVIDNFLPANHLIYNFLSSVNAEYLCIRTNRIKHDFNFVKKKDFVNFMYNCWEINLDYVYKQFGALLINVRKHRQSRNKLYKKYYKKIF